MEVYIFQNNEGEKVPKTVETLIVNEGVQVLPDQLCCNCRRLREVTLPNGLIKIGIEAFTWCQNLLEIRIPNTVEVIEEKAFQRCNLLTKVAFECSTTSAHQLKTVGRYEFSWCTSLQRIKLPSSVTTVGEGAFGNCISLVEANLSTTSVTEISDYTFVNCWKLQNVRLPNTLERICVLAFENCLELVTVVVPLDSQPIKIGEMSFYDCERLVNLLLPKDSTTEEDSFEGCTLLHQRYGEVSCGIVNGLRKRFENFRIHRMCYDHSAINNVQELRQCIMEQNVNYSLVDTFGMTPFHVFFSTAEPTMELLDVLLESLPYQILQCKDANGRQPVDYLIDNWTDGTNRLVERTLQKWMIERVASWGTMSWVEDIRNKIQELLAEDDKRRTKTLYHEACSALGHYEHVQATTILELGLWKEKLKSGWSRNGSKRQALDREGCKCLSGSDVVIPHVTTFLNIPRSVPESIDN